MNLFPLRKIPSVIRIFLTLVLTLLVVQSGISADSSDGEPSQVAVNFLNAYVKASASFPNGERSVTQWMAKEPNVTERFRKALARLYRDARARDPESGYGSDPIVGGQDFPNEFRVVSTLIEGEKARVVLIGTDPGFPMEVKVALIQTSGKWFVDGSGDLYN